MKNSIPELFPWQHTRSSGHIPSSSLPFQCSTLPTPQSSTFLPTAQSSTVESTPIQLHHIQHDHTYSILLHQVPPTQLTPIPQPPPTISPSVSTSINHKATQTAFPAFCIEAIQDDNNAIHFYTGFENHGMLLICYEFLGPSVKYWGSKAITSTVEPRGAPRALSPLNEFFLVLCRLRCGLLEEDLGFRFGISQSTV